MQTRLKINEHFTRSQRSYRSVAREAGIHHTQLMHLVQTPSAQTTYLTLYKLSKVFGCKPSDLIEVLDPSVALSPSEISESLMLTV